jgi:hypothetical protein
VDTAGCVLQGDVRTKVKTTGTGEIMVEEAVQTSTWRGCANFCIERLGKLHYSQSRVMPGPQYLPLLYFLKAPNAFLCLIQGVAF